MNYKIFIFKCGCVWDPFGRTGRGRGSINDLLLWLFLQDSGPVTETLADLVIFWENWDRIQMLQARVCKVWIKNAQIDERNLMITESK